MGKVPGAKPHQKTDPLLVRGGGISNLSDDHAPSQQGDEGSSPEVPQQGNYSTPVGIIPKPDKRQGKPLSSVEGGLEGGKFKGM